MLKHVLLLFIACFCGLTAVQAQQLPLFAQHPEYHGLINPASVYSDFLSQERTFSLGLSHRAQWGKLGKAAPFTQVAQGEYINLDHRFVVGGYLQNDHVGITDNFGAYGRFAYIIPTQDDIADGGLCVGLNVGLANWQLTTSRLLLTQMDDPDLPTDPSVWYPDVGFGAYWYNNLGEKGRYFYVGLSAPRTFDFGGKYAGATRYPHYYGLAGVHLPLLNGSAFEVSSWTRYVERIPAQTSLNARIEILKQFRFGFGAITDFKDTPFFTFELGYNLSVNDKYIIKIGYVYSSSNVRAYLGDAHEINLTFVLDNE